MLRNVVLVALIAFISGCGGGSGGSETNTGGGAGGGNSSDPLQQYINVSNQYTGIKTAANLDSSAVSRFMGAITMLQPELLPAYNDEQANLAELCSSGGQAALTPNAGNTELAIRFTNCRDSDGVLNGDATFRVNRRNAAGEVIEGLMIYKDTELSLDTTQFVLRGSIRQKDMSNSCKVEQNLSNLLLTVRDSGEQWYFENFYDQRAGTFGQGCLSEGMQFQGRVYLSNLGFVNVTTPQLFKLPSMVYGLELQGRLVLTGAANQVFSWQLTKYPPESQPLYSHHFTLTGDNAFAYQYRASILNDSMMKDFRDSDADGVPDVWELNYGFNPQNAADMSADYDGDGYSNLDEFTYLGEPKDASILPFIYNLSVSMTHIPGRQSELVYAGTTISHTSGADAYAIELIYKTELPFQFSDLSYKCDLTADRLEAKCKVDVVEAGTTYQHSVTLEAPSSLINQIQAPINVAIQTIGFNTSSQTTASTMLFRQAAAFNFRLNQAYPDTGTLLGVVGEQSGIMLRLSQDTFYDFVPGMTVNVVMPQELGSSTVVCRHVSDWAPCPGVKLIYSSDPTDIDIRFTPDRSGVGTGIVQVMAPGNSEPVAQWSFLVIAGQPASLLQQQIDASSTDVVSVPAGIYVGGLDLTAKKISIVGANQQTYLLGKIDDADYSLRQIHMDKGSEIRGFSLANLDITTGSEGAELTSNIMGIPELLQSGNDILAQGSLTLRKNKFSTTTFSHPFLWLSNINSCSKLRLQQNDSATPYNFVYENNLMFDDGLQEGYCSPIYLEGGYLSRVEHNTISEMDNFIIIQPSNETKVSRLLARNNVFHKVSTALALNFDMRYFDNTPDLQINVLNNLFDQVGNPVRSGNVPYAFTNNLMQPAGLDSSGNPLAGSAVIDAAANSEMTDDIFDNPRPVDGNGDGQALSDIGAVERQN